MIKLTAIPATSLLGCHGGMMDDDLAHILFGDDDVTPEGIALVKEREVDVSDSEKWRRVE